MRRREARERWRFAALVVGVALFLACSSPEPPRRVAAVSASPAATLVPRALPRPAQTVSRQRASTPRVQPAGNVEALIRKAAARFNIDADRFVRTARCESGLRPTALNVRGCDGDGCLGLFQQHRRYWPARARRAGLTGVSALDAWSNAYVSAWMIRHGGGWGHWRACAS